MELSIKNLMKPLVTALGKEHEKEALEIIGKEESGVLAWGVRSGYLLWTRQNPGVIPTKEQVRQWHEKAKETKA